MNWLTLLRKIILVYTKKIQNSCIQNADLLTVEAAGAYNSHPALKN
jgi:hypothetical protein